MSTDLALVSGKVLTMNPSQPSAAAIAVKNGKIVKVGTNEDVARYIGKNTKVIDLKGKAVVPGFIDTHIHVADFGRFLVWVNLCDVKSIKELQSRIRKRAKNVPKGKWIIGHGWDQTRLKEKRFPHLSDLDEASPNNPAIIYHQSGRTCVVNSEALKLAGVTNETAGPLGGRIY